MAALRATIQSDRKNSEASRLANDNISTETATWKTFVHVYLNADGSGTIEVKQNEKTIHSFNIPAETAKASKKAA